MTSRTKCRRRKEKMASRIRILWDSGKKRQWMVKLLKVERDQLIAAGLYFSVQQETWYSAGQGMCGVWSSRKVVNVQSCWEGKGNRLRTPKRERRNKCKGEGQLEERNWKDQEPRQSKGMRLLEGSWRLQKWISSRRWPLSMGLKLRHGNDGLWK